MSCNLYLSGQKIKSFTSSAVTTSDIESELRETVVSKQKPKRLQKYLN